VQGEIIGLTRRKEEEEEEKVSTANKVETGRDCRENETRSWRDHGETTWPPMDNK